MTPVGIVTAVRAEHPQNEAIPEITMVMISDGGDGTDNDSNDTTNNRNCSRNSNRG